MSQLYFPRQCGLREPDAELVTGVVAPSAPEPVNEHGGHLLENERLRLRRRRSTFLSARRIAPLTSSLMTQTELLEHRAAARASKRSADAELLRKHGSVVEALRSQVEGPSIRAEARLMVALWERETLCEPYYVRAWRRILALPASRLADEILRQDDEGVALRQNSPFGFFLHRLSK